MCAITHSRSSGASYSLNDPTDHLIMLLVPHRNSAPRARAGAAFPIFLRAIIIETVSVNRAAAFAIGGDPFTFAHAAQEIRAPRAQWDACTDSTRFFPPRGKIAIAHRRVAFHRRKKKEPRGDDNDVNARRSSLSTNSPAYELLIRLVNAARKKKKRKAKGSRDERPDMWSDDCMMIS